MNFSQIGVACIAVAMAFPGLSLAQNDDVVDESEWDEGDEGRAGHYLHAWLKLEDGGSSYRDQFLTMLGRHDLVFADSETDEAGAADRLPSDPEYELLDALAVIREAARDYRVVMINEAHMDARHRAFTTQLLIALREDGFTHLAAEAFFAGDMAALNERQYPLQSTGSYSRGPIFGDLVRQAGALGYIPVAYDQTEEQRCSECVKRAVELFRETGNAADMEVFLEHAQIRETDQAANLALALEANPDGRFIVHVGYGHHSEMMNEGGLQLMGAEFRTRTGIDPLTVDQMHRPPVMRSRSDSDLNEGSDPARYELHQVSALRDQNGDLLNPYEEYYDISVFHSELDFETLSGNRPAWLGMDGYRSPHILDHQTLPQERPILVQAFVEGEEGLTVPMDQYLLLEGETHDVTLMLPVGTFRLTVQRPTEPDFALGEVSIVEASSR